MLKECIKHGYFRGDKCPTCGEDGQFFMDDRELDHVARIVAGILRHFPDRYGLKLDRHGWVQVKRLALAIHSQQRSYQWLKAHHLIALAMTDPKGRYEVRDDLIRATYGHTLDLDLDLPTDGIPPSLYYPVTPEEADLVLESGLQPTDRKRVHLSLTPQDAYNAGKVRIPQPVILAVDTGRTTEGGHVIHRAGKKVFLVDRVPPEMLSRYEGEIPTPSPAPETEGEAPHRPASPGSAPEIDERHVLEDP